MSQLGAPKEIEGLSLFHPLIAQWFRDTYPAPTPIQRQSWPAIAAGDHCLITAPTGSGKTLTAFLWAIDGLVTGRLPEDRLSVLYISPLKALGSDVQKNLIAPIETLRLRFREQGERFPDIRVMTRSGDTPQSERRSMLRHQPEILITTPESFTIMMLSEGGRTLFGSIACVILDEIHSLYGTKRGVLLMSMVEQAALEWGEFQRIALTATVRPAEAVAAFIGGYRMICRESKIEHRQRPVRICTAPLTKRYDLSVLSPELLPDTGSGMLSQGAQQDSIWRGMAAEIFRLTERYRSTLVFANSRRLVEKIARLMNEIAGKRIAYAHHGSLSKEIRLTVESRLKRGELKAIIATNSLELGIDVGELDLVVLIQTPFTISSAIQKAGRAGHQVDAVSRAILFPSHGIDIASGAAMIETMQNHEIESLRPMRNPLDILAQIILSLIVIKEQTIESLFNSIRTAEPFASLPRRLFNLVVEMLTGKYEGTRIRALRPRLFLDESKGLLSPAKGVRYLLYLSGGTIPDRGQYNMKLADGLNNIGTLDEEFVWERSVGDRFELGTQTWEITSIDHNNVVVMPTNAPPNIIPFWRAEDRSRDFTFSRAILRLFDHVQAKGSTKEEWGLDEASAIRLMRFLTRQREHTGAPLPGEHRIIVEHIAESFGPEGLQRIVLHTFWGAAVNKPLALLIEGFWKSRFGYTPRTIASNDALLIIVPDDTRVAPYLPMLATLPLEETIRERLENSALFGAFFRENAGRALLLPRQSFGKRMPLWFTRLRSRKLLQTVFDLADFPIMIETWRSCLQDYFDLANLAMVLEELADGVTEICEVRTAIPSPFCDGLVWRQINLFMYADDTPEASGKSGLDDDLIDHLLDDPDRLAPIDPSLVLELNEKLQRTAEGYAPADPQELLRWIDERVIIPEDQYQRLIDAVAAESGMDRAEILNSIDGKLRLLYSEKGPVTHRCHEHQYKRLMHSETMTAALSELFRFYGPLTAEEIDVIVPLPVKQRNKAIAELLTKGDLVKARICLDAPGPQLCDKENLDRLLRMRRYKQRRFIEPMASSLIVPFMAACQGMINRGKGSEELASRIDSLLGYRLPADALEEWILPARMSPYYHEWIDALSQSHDLSWFGAGKKQIFLAYPEQTELFSRSEAAERKTPLPFSVNEGRGRYTFFDLKEASGLDSAELTQQLWELVWETQIANDSFAALRNGINTQFKAAPLSENRHRYRSHGAYHQWRNSRPLAGNWYLLGEKKRREDPLDREERIREKIFTLSDRYGVVAKPLLDRETESFQWKALLPSLRRMELSGEMVGGYFFRGLGGIQFVLSQAIQELLSWQERELDEVFWMNAVDPASPCGLSIEELPYELPSRKRSNFLVFHGSRLVLTLEHGGRSMTLEAHPGAPEIQRYLEIFKDLAQRDIRPPHSLVVESINAFPADQSPFANDMETFGFMPAIKGLRYDPRAAKARG
ncbi:DEAD/DEAH box helicase [Sediminispirochaeta bajacaliforniensis]|uniref:DEAD/DEAH box helicase n=1 Tax=Sediminispirochaeta bajacaliforniensis TaxID=148 RepID=UPI0003A30A5D|nr:DEAD/DEAH box helicase [Sediminispirochaeta bajacaliforniensis]